MIKLSRIHLHSNNSSDLVAWEWRCLTLVTLNAIARHTSGLTMNIEKN